MANLCVSNLSAATSGVQALSTIDGLKVAASHEQHSWISAERQLRDQVQQLQDTAAAALTRHTMEQQDLQAQLCSAQSCANELIHQVATLSVEVEECQRLVTTERSKGQELQQQLMDLRNELTGKAGQVVT